MGSRFRSAFGERFYWSVQNMNKGWDSGKGAQGPLWKHGRARLWMRLTKAQRADRASSWSFGISWSFGVRACRASFMLGDWGDDTDIGLSFAVPGISLHFDVEGVLPSKWRPKEGRDLGFFVGDGCIFVKLWASLDGHDQRKPFSHPDSAKRQPVLHVADWVLGRTKHTSQDLRLERAVIGLPEGEYPVDVTFTQHTWKRPRWRARTIVRANLQVRADSGIPIPGKGENDYDQEEDALYSLTTPAETLEQAMERLIASVARDRERYGGSTWLPESARA